MRSAHKLLLPLLAAAMAAASAVAMTPRDLATRLAANERILLVDLRPGPTFAQGHIPSAINISSGLLPHKPLPTNQLVVVYGDGLGVVNETAALSIVRAKPGVTAESLDGGYAAWLAETRITTAPPGVQREQIPGITYQQLVAANKKGMVLVDLRAPVMVAAAATVPRRDRPTAAAPQADVLEAFARKIGVPVIATGGIATSVATAAASATFTGGSPARAAAPVAGAGGAGQLLVLVADDNAAADAVARQLRASGHYRFTVLIGGTEIIQREGRIGMGRMDGDLPIVPRQP